MPFHPFRQDLSRIQSRSNAESSAAFETICGFCDKSFGLLTQRAGLYLCGPANDPQHFYWRKEAWL